MTRSLDGQLRAEQELTLAAYDVLDALAERRERGLRMTELADAVLLSRSGVTRLVDRMERLGLVRRVRVRGDGRGVLARITEDGVARLRSAAPTHRDGLARHFSSAAPGDDLQALARTCARLADGGVPAPPGHRAEV